MFLLRLAFKNALRNRRRSALTVATIVFGTAMLTIGLSAVTGVLTSIIDTITQSTGHVRVVTTGFVAKEQLRPLYENVEDTGPLVESLHKVPGVVGVYPRIELGVGGSKGGDELGEVFGLLVGAPVEYFDAVLDLKPRIREGRFLTDGTDEVLVGRVLAEQMGVGVGDDAIFVGQTQDGSMSPIKLTVVGITDSGVNLFDRRAYVPLERARWMADIPDGAVEVLVVGERVMDAGLLAERVRQQLADDGLGEDLVVQAWLNRDPYAGMLQIPKVILGGVSIIIVFVTALGVLNTMLMSVLERTAEIGVLRAMGMGRAAVRALFVFEAIAISLIGSTVGTTVGSLVALRLEAKGVDLGTATSKMPDTLPINHHLFPDWTPQIMALAFGLGLVMALFGSLLPALRASSIQPVTAMRSRR